MNLIEEMNRLVKEVQEDNSAVFSRDNLPAVLPYNMLRHINRMNKKAHKGMTQDRVPEAKWYTNSHYSLKELQKLLR